MNMCHRSISLLRCLRLVYQEITPRRHFHRYLTIDEADHSALRREMTECRFREFPVGLLKALKEAELSRMMYSVTPQAQMLLDTPFSEEFAPGAHAAVFTC